MDIINAEGNNQIQEVDKKLANRDFKFNRPRQLNYRDTHFLYVDLIARVTIT